MEWMKTGVFALSLVLLGTPAVAQQSKDPDEGTIQDTLQEPIGETLGMEGDEQKDKSAQETAVPKEEKKTKSKTEDLLNSPAEETLNQPVGETLEAVVPGSAATEVMGTIKQIDEKSGELTVETQDGKSVDLHADPSMLQGMKLKKDTKVTAKYEKQGDMNHVTQIEKAEKKSQKKQRM